jgi:hypothetical protein
MIRLVSLVLLTIAGGQHQPAAVARVSCLDTNNNGRIIRALASVLPHQAQAPFSLDPWASRASTSAVNEKERSKLLQLEPINAGRLRRKG